MGRMANRVSKDTIHFDEQSCGLNTSVHLSITANRSSRQVFLECPSTGC